MFQKIFSFQPSGSRKGLQYPGGDKIDDFYDHLAEGLKRLEDCIRSDPPSFTLESLSVAVDLVRSLHTEVHTIVQELWMPNRGSTGMDIVDAYLEMNKKALATCTRINNGILQLESYEMSLEHALTSLGSAVGSLKAEGEGEANGEGKEEEGSFSNKVRGSLEACKNELQRMESKKRSKTLWADFIAETVIGEQLNGGSGSWSGSGSGKSTSTSSSKELATMRSIVGVMLPTLSPGKKAFDILFVIVDAEYVTNFIECLILWVLSDSPENLSGAIDLFVKVKKSNGHSQWWVSLQKLRAKIEGIESKNEKDKTQERGGTKVISGDLWRVNSLREFEDLRSCVYTMYEKIEAGQKAPPDGSWKGLKGLGCSDTKLLKELENARGKLAEIMSNSERLASESSETYQEIISRRKRLVEESHENQLARLPAKS